MPRQAITIDSSHPATASSPLTVQDDQSPLSRPSAKIRSGEPSPAAATPVDSTDPSPPGTPVHLSVAGAPTDKPWGWRSYFVSDPNGVVLDFFHVYKEIPADKM